MPVFPSDFDVPKGAQTPVNGPLDKGFSKQAERTSGWETLDSLGREECGCWL